MLDKTTLQLFGKFPREVATPARSMIYNLHAFENFVSTNNGVVDCFASLYQTTGEVDKISFDIDGIGALGEAKQLYKFLTSKEFFVIPVVSGKKGYHFHVLIKTHKTLDNKPLLLNATLLLLQDAFGVNNKGELNCNCIDSHTFGDVRRIFRIPNTLRPPENRNWCTYLPPDQFLDMTEEEIAQHMKTFHNYDYSGKYFPNLVEFPKTAVKVRNSVQMEANGVESGKDHTILKNVLRPCLYRNIISSNPCHMVRVATTVELLDFFSPDEIAGFFSSLGWTDWDHKQTIYQIGSCKGLKPYSCKTLQQRGIPRACCIG